MLSDTQIDESVKDRYAFTNVDRNYADDVNDSFSDFDFDQEPNKYCTGNEVCNLPVVEFKDYKKN